MRLIRYISRYWYLFLLFTVLIFAAYGNSLGNAFVSDDHELERQLPTINTQYILNRPFELLRNVLYVSIYKLFGLQPFAFRFTNILFHLANTILVFMLIRKLVKETTAFFSAVLFAVHPILVESVIWISGGVYPQYSFFFLVSLVTYLYSYRRRKLYVMSVIFFVLSLLSSDKAIVLFPLYGALEWCFGDIKKHWKRLMPFAAITFAAGCFVLVTGRVEERLTVLHQDYYQSVGYDNLLLKVPTAFTSYFALFVWPQRLTFYHSEFQFSSLEFSIRIVITIFFLLVAIASTYTNKKLFFWFLFFVVPLLPSLTPFRIAWTVAERYVYLGTIGLTTLAACLMAFLWKLKRLTIITSFVFMFVLGGLIVRTVFRNMDFESDDSLWLATDKYSPNSTQNLNNLGDYYSRRKEYQRSIESYQKALALNPQYADVYNNLANTYSQMGQFEKAIELYEKALSLNPSLWQTYQNIAAIYVNNKQYPQAVAYMEKASKVRPELSRVWANLGVTYVLSGQTDKARDALTHALQLNPNEKGAQEALGLLR